MCDHIIYELQKALLFPNAWEIVNRSCESRQFCLVTHLSGGRTQSLIITHDVKWALRNTLYQVEDGLPWGLRQYNLLQCKRQVRKIHPLEEGMASHTSLLAWRIPWTEEPGRLQSIGLQRVGYNWLTNTFIFVRSRKFPSLPTLLKFYHGWAMNLSNAFMHPQTLIFFSLIILWVTLITFCNVKPILSFWDKPWSWYITESYFSILH